MGYRGPTPKPSVIEIAEGCPGKRPVNRREPAPRTVAPKCPPHLDELARKEWRRLVPVLRRMRVLTEADGIALGNLCQAYSTMITAQEKLNKMGLLYKAPSGYVMQSPLLGVVNQCVDTITKLTREFGLTPAARSRIIVNPPEDDGSAELWRILSQPRVKRTV
jgi:P27 family predicted phage terminase small subunit